MDLAKDRRLHAMLPLFAALFIDLFSRGVMHPVIVVIAACPASRSVYLSLAFSLFPFGMAFGAALLGDLSERPLSCPVCWRVCSDWCRLRFC